MTEFLNRRAFLARSAVLGCSLAASPLLTPVSFAAAPWDNRLVVIILRGAMDGLDVVRPYGDRDFAGHRPGALRGLGDGPDGAQDLDGFFALHPALSPLLPLWARGQVGFVHAVSTPYRDKRSHFDGQDLLEAGTVDMAAGAGRDGWLNRMLQHVPGVEAETAYAIGHDEMLLMKGRAQVADWSPDVGLRLSPQAVRLAEMVMHDDPLFRDAFAEAMLLSGTDAQGGMAAEPMQMQDMMPAATDMSAMTPMTGGDMQGGGMDAATTAGHTPAEIARAKGNQPHHKIAAFAGKKLRGDTRIASFSLNGWDTHQGQDRSMDQALGRLSDTILTLRDSMGGPAWGKTTIVAMTEFGRTARWNGSGGTDHGTAGAMLLAGGALKGGRVLGDWPGLAEADLYARRDLMPTRDVRAHAAWLMRGLFGLDQALLERAIFPGLDMGGNPGLLL